MKFTNKNKYNETIVRAIQNDTYSKGDSEFSCTGLIGPARIRVLTEKHKEEIVTDIDDEIFKLYGQVGHSLLERAGDSLKNVVEKRLFAEFDGVKISAQIDSLSLVNGILTDWKFTSVYGFMRGVAPKMEWVYQLNIQLELLRLNGLDADELQIVGILRDWRPGEAFKRPDYPSKIATHQIPVYPREMIQDYIRSRIKAHRDAEKELPLCTEAEHWEKKRCRNYCAVSQFCTQFKGEKK
jgi:hypothetical protein